VSGLVKICVRPDVRLETLVELAAERGWRLAQDTPRTHKGGTMKVWDVDGSGVLVGWSEEITTGVRAVIVKDSPELVAELGDRLPHYERAELLARAAEPDFPGAIDALRTLAIWEEGAFSPELVEAYARWAVHENRGVRRAVLHLGWVASRDILPTIEARCSEDSELADKWEQLRAVVAKR
jgi:hypothetical protein